MCPDTEDFPYLSSPSLACDSENVAELNAAILRALHNMFLAIVKFTVDETGNSVIIDYPAQIPTFPGKLFLAFNPAWPAATTEQ